MLDAASASDDDESVVADVSAEIVLVVVDV